MNSDFRHQLLSLSSLVDIAAPWAAFAQAPIGSVGSSSVRDHAIQLGRISNAHSQLLAQLQQQLSDNQSNIDSLRDQIQENQYQLNQIVERQKQTLLQIDNLSSGGVTAQSTSDDQGGVAALTTSTVDAGTASADAPMRSGDASAGYSAAIALVQDKPRQDDTMVAFQNFIENYPDSTYLPNANYWLGQLNYSKGKKGGAAYYFASVVKNYPKPPKAADTMFKVGVIMQNRGNTAKTKAIHQQVISKYPGTDSAKQTQKRLNAAQCITHDQKSHYFWSRRASHKQLSDLYRNLCCAQV